MWSVGKITGPRKGSETSPGPVGVHLSQHSSRSSLWFCRRRASSLWGKEEVPLGVHCAPFHPSCGASRATPRPHGCSGWRPWGASQGPTVHAQRLTAHPSFCNGLASYRSRSGMSSQWQRWWVEGKQGCGQRKLASCGAAHHPQSPHPCPHPAWCWAAAAGCLAGLTFSPGGDKSVFADLSFSRLKKKKCEVCYLIC